MALSPIQTAAALGARQTPGGPDLVGYLLTCALVLGLVLGAAWLFRRFISGSLRAKAAARSLQIVDVLPLGGRQRLVVVRCYDRTFLLGQGEKEVRAIGELDVEQAQESLPAPASGTHVAKPKGKQAKRAADAFAKLLGRAGASPDAESMALKHASAQLRTSQPAARVVEERDPETRPTRAVLDGGKGILG